MNTIPKQLPFTAVRCAALGLLATLFLLMLWRIWKYMRRYAEFPTFPLLLYGVYLFFTRKIPKDLPFTAAIFQHLVLLSEQFQKEGVFLLWLPRPHLFVFGEDIVKALSQEPAALDKSSKYDVVQEFFGNGLITSNGQTWKTHRKLLTPMFHVRMMQNKVSIFNENAKILVKNLELAMNETSIDILDILKTCSFGSICDYVFGLKMNSPEKKEAVKNYIKLVSNVFEMIVQRFACPWMHFKFMKKYFPSYRKYTKLIDDGNNFAREIYSAMRENIILQNADRTGEDSDWNEDKETRKSFAHILLDHHLKDNTFTMEDVQNQVTTFTVAGYETISYALLWSLFMLGHHPDVQNRAYNEVDTISDGMIKYEDLHKLKYLECVIKETLRLYPPVPIYARKLKKDVQCGKYNVPKGTEIVFSPFMLHRNPEVYREPEKFDPERFLEGNSEKQSASYIPFSEGIRNCLGKRFAIMEMKVVLSYILRNFMITSLDRGQDVVLNWNMSMGPAKPLRFKITPRK